MYFRHSEWVSQPVDTSTKQIQPGNPTLERRLGFGVYHPAHMFTVGPAVAFEPTADVLPSSSNLAVFVTFVSGARLATNCAEIKNL